MHQHVNGAALHRLQRRRYRVPAKADEASLALLLKPQGHVAQAVGLGQSIIVLLPVAVVKDEHVDIVGIVAGEEIVEKALAGLEDACLFVLPILVCRTQVRGQKDPLAPPLERSSHHITELGLGKEQVKITHTSLNRLVDHADHMLARPVDQILGAQTDGTDVKARSTQSTILHV